MHSPLTGVKEKMSHSCPTALCGVLMPGKEKGHRMAPATEAPLTNTLGAFVSVYCSGQYKSTKGPLIPPAWSSLAPLTAFSSSVALWK